MQSTSCLFCKIIARTIPSAVIRETDDILVIRDISPKAPTHYLIIPKHHVESISSLTEDELPLATKAVAMARDLASELPTKSFNLIANNGAAAGQSVFHLHFHFLAGKNLYEHGLAL